MSSTRAPSGIRARPFPYEDFQGIDASRDKAALDTGEKQHMVSIDNGYADWRGTLVRDPGATQRTDGGSYIKHVTFFGRDLLAWAQRSGGGTSLKSERGHEEFEVYPRDAVVTSTVFNNKAIFMARDNPMYAYDGVKFSKVVAGTSRLRPAFGCSIQRRLAIAGAGNKRTVIDISRVDRENVFANDEDQNSTDVTKGADIDVVNIIGTADEIKGLGVFETNRLAVFTNDQTLVYQLHPDFTLWALDDKANVKVGCLSHNTISAAGSDLIFCSRDGIHSLRRSDTNGITIFSLPLSIKIDRLYRALVRQVPDPESISAFYDQDEGQYHVFFPTSDVLSTRLTMTVSPVEGGDPKWSTASFLNATCGSQLGGVTVLGTPGGVWRRTEVDEETDISPEMVITTPLLWNGSLIETKESHSFILQATGKGEIQVEAYDDTGRYLSSMQFLIEGGGVDDKFPDVPLSRQYQRKFEHRYRGVQFRFTVKGRGLLKIIGFAVMVRT